LHSIGNLGGSVDHLTKTDKN